MRRVIPRLHFSFREANRLASANGGRHMWRTGRRWQSTSATGQSAFARVGDFAKRNWFTLALPVTVMLCKQNPDVMRTGGYVSYEKLRDPFIFCIFLAAGMTIPIAQMQSVIVMWRVHAAIQATIFLLSPLLFLATAPLLRDRLGMPEAIAQGWVLLGLLPTSVGVSVAVTKIGAGDVSMTLLNAAFSNLLGVALTPMLCQWASGVSGGVDALEVIKKLAVVVALPSILGMSLRFKLPIVAKYDRVWGIMQPVCLLTVLSNVFANAFHQYSDGVPGLDMAALAKLVGACAAANVTLMTVVFGLTSALSFAPANQVAAVICGAQKTAAMGIPLMTAMYSDDPNLGLLTLPVLLYNPVQASVGGVYATWMRSALKLH